MKNRLCAWMAAFGCLIFTSVSAEYECDYVEQGYCQEEICQEKSFRWSSLFEESHCPGPYVGILGGVNFLSDIKRSGHKAEFKTGYLLGITGGYRFCAYRVEGEFAYRNNSVDVVRYGHKLHKPRLHESTYSLMLNGYWDVNVDYCVKPYLGLGLGYAWNETHVKYKRVDVAYKKSSFAWQVMVGGAYDLTDCIQLTGEYRYFGNSETDHQALVFGVAYAL